jgi:hypothetical protein
LHPQGYLHSFIPQEKIRKKTNKNIFKIAAMIVGALIVFGISFFAHQSNLQLASVFSLDSFFENQTKNIPNPTPKKIANKSEDKIEFPYTHYLSNPAEPYYLIVKSDLKINDAQDVKLKFRKDGYDARIIQIDSTFQVGIYEFCTSDEIQQIKNNTDSLFQTETKLMKLMD